MPFFSLEMAEKMLDFGIQEKNYTFVV